MEGLLKQRCRRKQPERSVGVRKAKQGEGPQRAAATRADQPPAQNVF